MLVDEDEEGVSSDMAELAQLANLQSGLKALKKKDDLTQTVLSVTTALAEAVEDLARAQKENAFYDKDLNTSMTGALTKLSEAIMALAKEQKIDLAPFTKANEASLKSMTNLVHEVHLQHKEIVESISALKSENPNYESILQSIVEALNKNSKILTEGLKTIDYTKELDELAKRPKKWNHKMVRNSNGTLTQVISTAE